MNEEKTSSTRQVRYHFSSLQGTLRGAFVLLVIASVLYNTRMTKILIELETVDSNTTTRTQSIQKNHGPKSEQSQTNDEPCEETLVKNCVSRTTPRYKQSVLPTYPVPRTAHKSSAMEEYELVRDHVRAIRNAYDDLLQKESTGDDIDFVLFYETNHYTATATMAKARETTSTDLQHARIGISNDFFHHDWKKYLDAAPLDWVVLALSSFADERMDERATTDGEGLTITNILANSNKNTKRNQEKELHKAMFRKRASTFWGKGEPWISWSPFYSWGTRAYIIRRSGMKHFLERIQSNHNSNSNDDDDDAENNSDTGTITATNVKDLFGALMDSKTNDGDVGEEFLFLNVGGSVYSATFPIKESPTVDGNEGTEATSEHAVVIPDSDATHMQLVCRSVLVLSTLRIQSTDTVEQEASFIEADAHELWKVHRMCASNGFENTLTPHWRIKVVVTSEDLLAPVQRRLDPKSSRFCLYHIHFEFVVEKDIFNKYVWMYENRPFMPKYDKVVMKDSDQRIAGMSWRTFIDRGASNALVAGPIREILNDSMLQNRFTMSQGAKLPLMQGKAWMGGRWYQTYNTKRKLEPSVLWQVEQYSDIRSFEVPFLEQYFVALDGKFAHWFFGKVLSPWFLGQLCDWGIDLLWCAAARSFDPSRPSCVFVLVNSIHEDTRTIKWVKDKAKYMPLGFNATEGLKAAHSEWYRDNNFMHCFYGCYASKLNMELLCKLPENGTKYGERVNQTYDCISA